MPLCHSRYTCNPGMKQNHARLKSCTVCMSTVQIIVNFNGSIKVLSEIHSNDQNTKQETPGTIKCSMLYPSCIARIKGSTGQYSNTPTGDQYWPFSYHRMLLDNVKMQVHMTR